MLRQARRFVQFSKSQRHITLYAALLLAIIKLGLGLLPFQTLQRLVARIALFKPNWLRQLSVAEVVRAVNRCSRYMPGGAKCLARALTTQTILMQSGCFVELCIGVAKNQSGALEAHAWIEHNNQVIMGKLSDLDRYIPLSPRKVKSI